jgi:hypothetical protein
LLAVPLYFHFYFLHCCSFFHGLLFFIFSFSIFLFISFSFMTSSSPTGLLISSSIFLFVLHGRAAAEGEVLQWRIGQWARRMSSGLVGCKGMHGQQLGWARRMSSKAWTAAARWQQRWV